MRIQNNIMAINAYRNYNNNTSALSKNLEKLSSGYRINRAGDDAAGLAISEKMRAQITGLDAAQKNVKDGISLVKTAEGAMQEIQDMLNRVKYLATQSSNGTYQDDVDREALQDELYALTDEIDRIADSANFNGISLLDGSLSGNASGASDIPAVSGLELADTAATKGQFVSADFADVATGVDGNVVGMTVNYTDENGKSQAVTVQLAIDGTNNKLVASDGTTYDITGANDIKKGEFQDAFLAELNKTQLSDAFKISEDGGDALQFDSRVAGSATKIDSILSDLTGANASVTNTLQTLQTNTKGEDAFQSVNLANDYTMGDVFSVGGKKFAFVKTQDEAVALGSNVNAIVVANNTNVAAADVQDMADLIEQKTGYKPTVNTTSLEFKSNTSAAGAAKGGLTLQIGDTGDTYNQITVSIQSMKAKDLGVSGLDISTRDAAQNATDAVEDIINSVSATRGKLGAIQNRLEHTTNNLSVMAENIQDAESSIRDTDVAQEMMDYTKNNILIQSAQAMLAQANAVPQGVLQLLG